MSMPHSFPTTDAPHIHLEAVHGDLVLRGWEHQEFSAAVAPNALTVRQTEQAIFVTTTDDCVLQVPRLSRVRIGMIAGDATINGIQGDCQIEKVAGNLVLRRSGDVVIQQIAGDLAANNIDGNLTVEEVAGDAAVSTVTGNCTLSLVHDDLSIGMIGGNLHATAGDDLAVRINPQAGSSYTLRAGGDLSCRLPGNADAQIQAQAGKNLRVRGIPGHENEARPHAGAQSFTLGSGASVVALVAEGDLQLTVSDTFWASGSPLDVDVAMEMSMRAAEIAQQLGTQIEAQVLSVSRQLDEKLSQFAGGEDLATKVQERVQAALRNAESKISEAMKSAEVRINQAEQRAAKMEERQRRQPAAWQAPPPPKPAKPEKPPLSDDERLQVLRMVEDGKISVDQAEKLLAALRAGRQTR